MVSSPSSNEDARVPASDGSNSRFPVSNSSRHLAPSAPISSNADLTTLCVPVAESSVSRSTSQYARGNSLVSNSVIDENVPEPKTEVPESENTHSNTTSPSTDGTVASGFTEDIVRNCLAKISYKDGTHRSICMTQNCSVPQWIVYLFDLPKSLAYDRILEVATRFGDTKVFNWSTFDPSICEIAYLNPYAAEHAARTLDRSSPFVGKSSIRAKLRAVNPNHQLVATDLPVAATDEVLEELFGKLVDSKVHAIVKHDSDSKTFSNFAFLSFTSAQAASSALIKSEKLNIEGRSISVYEYAQYQTDSYLFAMNMNPNVTIEALEELFGKFGNIDEEGISIIRRSYAFAKFKTREGAEAAKRELNRTDLKGPIIVRYAEAEQNKRSISVQFKDANNVSVTAIREATIKRFSEYGKCSVVFEFSKTGDWRSLAFVTYDGDSASSSEAAASAMENVTKIGSIIVWCQWARELIPRMPPKCLHVEKQETATQKTSLNAKPPTPFKPNRVPTTPPPTPINPNSVTVDENMASFSTSTTSYNPGHQMYPGMSYTAPYVYPSHQMDMVHVMMPQVQAQQYQNPDVYYPHRAYYWNGSAYVLQPNYYYYPHMHQMQAPSAEPYYPNPAAAPYIPNQSTEEGNKSSADDSVVNNNENINPKLGNKAAPPEKPE